MNYDEALQYIWSIKKFTNKTDLKTMQVMMRELNHPQRKLKVIHVAGTNGKGSVCNYIAASLQAAGYRTGLYLSPFLEIFNERMRVNGILISNEELVELVEQVKPAAEQAEKECGRFPKQFEFVTAIAFLYFVRHNCDYVVLETGMGGLLDATNVVEQPVVSVITSVGLDHIHILGNTLEEIAEKKSGIIKQGCPVVCDPFMDERAKAVIARQAKQKDAIFVPISSDEVQLQTSDMERICFRFRDEGYQLQMVGDYQVHNCVLALGALQLIGVPVEAAQRGVESVRFPGRMEKILPHVLADGAHNEMGIRVLMESLQDRENLCFVLSIGKEKQYRQMLSLIFEQAGKHAEFYFSAYDENAAVSPHELCRYAAEKGQKGTILADIPQVVDLLLAPQNADRSYVLCGSLYFIGGVKNEIKRRQLHKKTEK